MMVPVIKWEDLRKSLKHSMRSMVRKFRSLTFLWPLNPRKKMDGFAISETAFFIFVLMASR